jgi:hypothetical protein
MTLPFLFGERLPVNRKEVYYTATVHRASFVPMALSMSIGSGNYLA